MATKKECIRSINVKIFTFLLFLSIGFGCFSQNKPLSSNVLKGVSFFPLDTTIDNVEIFATHPENYFYQFKIVDVLTSGNAKLFNEATRGLFDVIPIFNAEKNQFEFYTNVNFKYLELIDKLKSFGYSIEYFYKNQLVE